MDDLFAPPDEDWQRLSPRYATVRRVSNLTSLAMLASLVCAGAFLLTGTWALAGPVLGAAAAMAAWNWWRIGRWVRAFGYAERAEDLFLSKGLWFRQLTVVPYGRLQVVKVEAGPLERALGLASVILVTASMQTDARIPGLPTTEAARLRDRLIVVGQALGSGL